ncbi:hypothetical protein N798_04250 [Knoellia flava TL1]|uniref:Copper type II ascorbate-dependent monooxygenase C-terminal domain-containing protein n=2 Tax=Knoellia flava TaxID=913969 RepID=A0A8H9KS23_9MICO|nr:hypothetical protein [Knoellia flava]KGN35125.1 hypothetical protein N798_04250 [Knoellia flava TL1]GGB86358.1 hypothetical protein GCM10011314_27680 [Knoellia flava]
MRLRLAAAGIVAALTLTACGGTLPDNLRGEDTHGSSHGASSSPEKAAAGSKPAKPEKPDVPLRKGEAFQDISMAAKYTPKAPFGSGTDDYRCFLVDPNFAQDMIVSGVKVMPDNPDAVHHVILYKVEPQDVAAAKAQDAQDEGDGWTCFGGTGIKGGAASQINSAEWVAAWAPGGGERVMAEDIGIPLAKGSQLVMQMHYNLLVGDGPDQSSARLRLTPAAAGTKTPLQTMLLPAPVELPCRKGTPGELCARTPAVADIRARFGEQVATADLLHLLCGELKPGPTQSCTRPVTEAGQIRAVAGHMHLLGKSITVDVNKGTPQAKRVLDIPVWNFDDQDAVPLPKPQPIKKGDTLTVTCTHDQAMRDVLPAYEGTRERYVAWGEGTTDEMCLGVVLLTRG